MANKRKKNKDKEAVPFSRLDVYKELQTINKRVSNILENYEEFGPVSSYTDEQVDYVKGLIAKYEENRLQKRAALKTINTFYRAQLEKFQNFDSESNSTSEIPSEFLKDIQHHEFRNAYVVTLQALDKLKSIMDTATKLSNASKSLSNKSSGTTQADKEKGDENTGHDKTSTAYNEMRSDYTNMYLKQSKLEAIKSEQEKELKSIKAAYNELLVEKQRSVDAIGEVDKLKKELNQAHKEVEALHRSLERQQKSLAKQRKMSNAMITPSNSNSNVEMQDIETPERNYEKQQTFSRKMTTKTTTYNNSTEEVPKTSQKSSFTSSTYSLSTFDNDLSKKHKAKSNITGTESIGGRNGFRNKYIPSNKRQYTTASRFPDIHSKTKTGSRLHLPQEPQHKQREPVKLPLIDCNPVNSQSLSKHDQELTTKLNTEHNSTDNKRSKQATHKLASSDVVAKTLLDLHDKNQLTVHQIKQDQKDALDTLIKEPIPHLTKEEQLDKAAQATVEYVNMSKSINEVGQILKLHCEQNNKAYQRSVIETEEESRDVITSQYSEFVKNIISAVDFVDNELKRDGILGGGSFNPALKSQWLNPIDSISLSTQNQSKDLDFITNIANALEMISSNCKSYLQHIKLSIIEQEKRLSALQNASPQIYQKCVKQLEKGSQYPNVIIDKSLSRGSQQMCSMLEDHIAKIQSAIETFNHKRELLVMETKSKIQSYVPGIIEIIDRISSLCAEDANNIMFDELQNAVKKLDQLCKSTQIVRDYVTTGEDIIDKTTSFSELSKSVLKEVQGQVKNIISNKLGVMMPDQLDFKVTGNQVYNTIKRPVFFNKHIQNLAQDFHEPLWSGQLSSSNSDGQNINGVNIRRRSSMWDPLIYHSPLATMEESSDLAKGITGTTIGKRTTDNREMSAKKKTNGRLPKLHVKSYSRRKYQPDNVKIKITIKNRLIRGRDNGSKGEPLECFKVTPLSNKYHK